MTKRHENERQKISQELEENSIEKEKYESNK